MTIERVPIENREQWLGLRRQVVTATDVAAVSGVHPYRTPLRVWAEKAGDISDEIDDNAAMRRGRWMESAVFAALEERRPELKLERAKDFLMDKARRIGGTPDGYAIDAEGKRFIVEAKTVAKPTFEKDWGDDPPMTYYLQALTYAMLEEAAGAIIAVLVIDAYDTDLRIYEVPRHPGAEARILKAVESFWSSVDAGQEPAPIYERDVEVLQSLRRPSRPDPIDLSSDNHLPVLLAERARLMEDKAEVEKRLDAIKAEVIDKLAGHQSGLCDGYRLTHTIQSRKETVLKASSFPVLRVTRINQKAEKAA
jgi:putative phage-type endonuclease